MDRHAGDNDLERRTGWRGFRRLVSCCVLLGSPVFLSATGGGEVLQGEVVSRHPAPLADVLEIQSPAEDLLLERTGEIKAEALAHFMIGLIHEDNAENGEMLEAFQRTLDLDPGMTDLAVKVAFEYVRMDDIPAGIGVLKDAAKFDESNPRPYLHLASLYLRSLRKYDQAEKYALRALELVPDMALPYQTLLEIHVAQGGYRDALALLRRALSAENSDPEFWLGLGLMAARIGTGAGGEGASLPDGWPGAVSGLFDRALKHADGRVSILNAVADHFLQTNRIESAISLYLRIVESNPESADPMLDGVREKLASSLLASGDRARAMDVLEKMVEKNPMRGETYEFLASLYEQGGELGKALANYEQVLLIDPDDPLNHLRVADVYVRLGDHDRAIEVLEGARKRFPDVPQMTYSLAIAYTQAGMHEAALKTFELALSESSIHGEHVESAAFYFHYGIAAESAGDIRQAIRHFKKSIALDPANSAPALNYLGYMMVVRGENLNEAEAFIKRALEIDPENGAYIDSLGWLYYQRGEFRRALAELLRAEQFIDPSDPSNYEIFDHIGDAYGKLGNDTEAIAYWRRALKLADGEMTEIGEKIANAEQRLTSRSTGDLPIVGE